MKQTKLWSKMLLTFLISTFAGHIFADAPKITVINQVGYEVGMEINDYFPTRIPSGGKFELKKDGNNLSVTVNGKQYVGQRILINMTTNHAYPWWVAMNIDPTSYQTDTTLIMTREGNNVKLAPSNK